MDAATVLLELWPEPAQAREELDRQLAALPPEVKVPEEFQHLVVAVPQSDAGRGLQELLDASSFAIPSTLLSVDDDIVFCHETAGLPLQEMATALAGDPERYAEVAPQIVTRTDIAWSSLEATAAPK
jgi:hypothetical protein